MAVQSVQSEGIFHGLPVFPDHDRKGYTAIVTGANGISGAHILRTLANTPERWSKIYALSRKPPNFNFKIDHEKVTFISTDFLDTPEKIAKVLQDAKVSAYVQYSHLNHTVLSNKYTAILSFSHRTSSPRQRKAKGFGLMSMRWSALMSTCYLTFSLP